MSLYAAGDSSLIRASWESTTPAALRWIEPAEPPVVRPSLKGAGTWDHLYGSTANRASSDDRHVHHRLQTYTSRNPCGWVRNHFHAVATTVSMSV